MDNMINNKFGNESETSLVHCLGLDEDEDCNMHGCNDVTLIKKSPYFTLKEYKETICNTAFTLISINIQSLNAKVDELRILINDINNSAKSTVSAIVIQETWLSGMSDLS